MTEIEEGGLTFSFPDHCEAGKYDEWSFYREQFQSAAGGSKAVDMLCIADDVAWLIEVKDYRHHRRAKAIDLCDEGSDEGTRHAGGFGCGECKRRQRIRTEYGTTSIGSASVARRVAPGTAGRRFPTPASAFRCRERVVEVA